jgi:uncharacterized surface protein with fasciclin (FAS1) repeats
MKIPQYLSLMLGLFIMTAAGCTKKKDAPAAPEASGSSIAYVLNDNFPFSSFCKDLSNAGLIDTLGSAHRFTALAPNNDAYALSGISLNLLFRTPATLRSAAAYHLLSDSVVFGPMPLVQNKPMMTLSGQPVFFSKYEEAGDTITTVNGLRLVSMDNLASNGPIQVLPEIMNPLFYPTLDGRMRNDTLLTLFCAMVQRAGLDSLLANTDTYTVLAPYNASLRATAGQPGSLDLSSLDHIAAADPDTLKNMVAYCILKDRYFLGDLYHSEYTQPTGVTMLNGETIGITGSPGVYHSIRFTGKTGVVAGIYSFIASSYNYADFPCGNGVLHIINQVLIP